MTYYYMYKITNVINGKIYIGVHRTNNLDDGYMGSGTHLKRSIHKYGIENFTKKILKWFDSEEEMYSEEAELVNEEFIKREDTYNISYGGNGNWSYVNKVRKEKYGDGWAKISGMKTQKILKKKYGEDCYSIIGKKGIKTLKEKYGDSWAKIIGTKAQKILKEKYPKGTWKDKRHTEESKKKIGQSNAIKQSGKGNSQYGKCWIYNTGLKENKSIPKEEIQQWLDMGWIKGRKMKF